MSQNEWNVIFVLRFVQSPNENDRRLIRNHAKKGMSLPFMDELCHLRWVPMVTKPTKQLTSAALGMWYHTVQYTQQVLS